MSDNGVFQRAGWRDGEIHTQNYPLNSGKGSAYEGGVREPMIVRWPGVVKPGSKCDKYLIIEDFYPTILEMAGIRGYKTVQPIDGVSFMPLLKVREILPWDVAYSGTARIYGVMTGRESVRLARFVMETGN